MPTLPNTNDPNPTQDSASSNPLGAGTGIGMGSASPISTPSTVTSEDSSSVGGTVSIIDGSEDSPYDSDDPFKSKASKGKGGLIIIFFIIINIALGGFIYYGYTKLAKPGVGFIDTILGDLFAGETKDTDDSEKEENGENEPADLFISAFESNDYKVSASGKATLDLSEYENGSEQTGTQAIDLEGALIYFQGANLVSFEGSYEDGSGYRYILKDDTLLAIDTQIMEYSEYSIDSEEGALFNQIIQGNPLLVIYNALKSGVELTEAEGGQYTMEYIWKDLLLGEEGESYYMTAEISFGSEDNLVSSISLKKTDDGEEIGTFSFIYEVVENIEEVLVAPEGYTKVED